MPYMEQMESGLKSLVQAGEAGRQGLDGMLGPMNGAIGDITGAASELESIPFVGPEVGEKLQRTMRGINLAQSKVGEVAAGRLADLIGVAGDPSRDVTVLGDRSKLSFVMVGGRLVDLAQDEPVRRPISGWRVNNYGKILTRSTL